ncbi:MAG: hypothetical protein R3A13_03760 [Bdellovibrionota bacterium]
MKKLMAMRRAVDITAKLDGKVRNTTVEMQKIDGRSGISRQWNFAKEQGQQGIPGG